MYMYMYMYMHMNMCLHIYPYIHAYMHTSTHTHMLIHIAKTQNPQPEQNPLSEPFRKSFIAESISCGRKALIIDGKE